MDCKQFRKYHLAYLDDTLAGDLMAKAQRHVLACDGCAAHDTLVRRSLMVARSMPTLEPSAQFQERLRARLAECRSEVALERDLTAQGRLTPAVVTPRPARAVMAMAASAMLGALAWQAFRDGTVPELSMQPVIASTPASMGPASSPAPYLSPAVMRAMSTGNPVWPVTMIVDDAPVGFVNASYSGYSFADIR